MSDLDASDYIHTPAGTRQRDLTPRVEYDRRYVEERYAAIDDRVRGLADRRVGVLNAFAGPTRGGLLDFGCGTGRVVQAATAGGWLAYGHDLAPVPGVPTVPKGELRAYSWRVVTFFDSLEHLPDPAACVRALAPEWVMVSVPWCHRPADWDWFGKWKHRRPGEHLHHWNRDTLAEFFRRLGYRCVMTSDFEDEFRPHPEQPEPNVLSALFRRPPSPGTL